MTAQNFFRLTVLVLASVFQSCANDTKKPAAPVVTTAPVTPEENQQAPVTNTATPTDAGNNAPEVKGTDPKKGTKGGLSENSKPAGPLGYITRQNVALLKDPSVKAPQIATCKQYELVVILETLMTNDKGETTQYPTWYKVERENKQRGWVMASGLNAGGGG